MADKTEREKLTRKSGRGYDDGAKAIIRNVLQVCQEEKDNGKLAIPLSAAIDRASMYTGVSRATIFNFKTRDPASEMEPIPRSDVVDLDNFDKGVVRRTFHDLIANQHIVPTATTLKIALQQKIGYQCGITHLRKILKELGFKWKKPQTNRELLMERSDIVANRIQFLRRIKKYREQGWTVVYTDETYVHTSHTVPKTWQSDDSSMKVPFSKGQRYIIVHAGTKAGFIQGAKLTFKAESETGDYHKEMNADNFFKWVRERLIPNLPAKSVVIIDNAPYHNIQIDKCPTTATRKADIQAWMNRHNIAFTADMFKPELLQLCRQNKPSPSYVLDNLLREHGHECLRLPPYHADLNAIELIWGIMKHFVAAHNVTFKSADVQQITQNAIDSVSPADWSGCCGHVEKVEKSYWETNIAIEDEIEKFIIEVTSSDEDTDTASECTDYSDTDTAEES